MIEKIGELKDVAVMIDRKNKAVILGTEPPIKFSIDHPYIQGTKLEREARAALDCASITSSEQK